MTKRGSKSQLTWTDVKAQLATFDRTALLDLLHLLYAANKDNQAFLHARFGLGEDVLEPYTELMVFYCEQATGYCQDIGYQEEGFSAPCAHVRASPQVGQHATRARLR